MGKCIKDDRRRWPAILCGGLSFPQAGWPDNGNYQESEDVGGNVWVALSDEKRKTLGWYFGFFQNVYAFRSRKVVVSFHLPEKQSFFVDINYMDLR